MSRPKGFIHSKETIEKIRKSNQGKFVSLKTRILQSLRKGKDGDIKRLTLYERLLKDRKIICEECKINELEHKKINGFYLSIHHKDRNKNNNELENIKILCNSCHLKEHNKEMLIQRKIKAGY